MYKKLTLAVSLLYILICLFNLPRHRLNKRIILTCRPLSFPKKFVELWDRRRSVISYIEFNMVANSVIDFAATPDWVGAARAEFIYMETSHGYHVLLENIGF